jgi:aryl-alcohol dehydrogenase-like predicted oxidoreductase
LEHLRLGRTDLTVSRTGFGALPIQRVSEADAGRLLRTAFDAGVTFFDTARMYTDSEHKIGVALGDVRDRIVIATKSMATDRATLLAQLETSLRELKTDHVDIYQWHNPYAVDYDDPEGAYAGMVEAREKGLVRFLGLTNHRLPIALEAVASGRFDTIQFPLNILSSADDLTLIETCRANDVGLIAMKAMSGGLIRRPDAAFAFLRQYDNVLPIWGVQRPSELEEFLAFEADPPALDEAMLASIETERAELSGDFCRGCGYCLPCPAGIPISNAARLSLLMARAPAADFLTDEFAEQMERIEECTECGHCRANCPYGLDTPALLRRNLEEYRAFRADPTRTA